MKWSQLRTGFPVSHGPAREAAIVEAVRAGYFVMPTLVERTIVAGGYSMRYQIAAEPLRLGEPGDSVTPMVTAATAQQIADLLGMRLPTPRLLDHAASTADCLIDFAALFSDVADTSTAHMERQSAKIDQLRGSCEGLTVSSKQWVVSPRLLHPGSLKWGKNTAANYGGWTRSPMGKDGKQPWQAISISDLRVWQPLGFAHDTAHTDYSQLAPQLIYALVDVSDASGTTSERVIDSVARAPETAALVSAQGPVLLRYPFARGCQSLNEGGSCGIDPAPPMPEPPNTPDDPLPQGTDEPTTSRAKAAIVLAAIVAGVYYLVTR